MSTVHQIHSQRIAEEEAAQWVVRVDREPLSGDERAEFKRWLEFNKHNRDAFIELAQVWGGLEQLNELADLIPLASQSSARGPVPSDRQGRSFWLSGTVAAALILMGVSASVLPAYWGNIFPSEELHAQILTTDIGQQHTTLLPDGSVVQLNTDSNINVQYDENTRNLYLNRGEAHFDVAHDSSRPFIVHVGNGTVTAVGTEFNIHRRGDDIDLIVTEGEVRVDTQEIDLFKPPQDDGKQTGKPLAMTNSGPADSGPANKIIHLRAGQELSFGRGKTKKIVKLALSENVEKRLAWQQGMLSFSGESLDEAIKEISRYTDTHIIVNDPDVSSLEIGGYFKATETKEILDVLQLSFGLEIVVLSDKVVILKKGPNFGL